MIRVAEIKLNYQSQLMAVTEMPQFNWLIDSDQRNTVQEAYQLQIACDPDFEAIVFDSGWVQSAESAQIEISGVTLKPVRRYYTRVRILANQIQTEFCNPVTFVTGLAAPQDWQGAMISAETPDEAELSKGTYVRKEFHIDRPVREAYALSTSWGLYQLFLNGQRIGKTELSPGWTSYNKHLLYQVHDVTHLLQEDTNAIGAMIGAGWYKGKMGFTGLRNHYGKQTAFSLHLLVRFADGQELVIATDETWKGSDAPVVFSEIYDGETYDQALEQPGWDKPDFNDSNWRPVSILPFDQAVLSAQEGAAVEEMEEKPVESLFVTPAGDLCLDFGQNLSGWIHFTAMGKQGDRVELNCFETLDAQGNAYFDNLRGARQTLTYIFAREGEVAYHPCFSFQGFRYARIASWPGEPHPENFVARVIYSRMEPTGSFTCSNEDLNQLNRNVTWSLKGNFVDIPTDCPQRNERLGWTGDAQIFARTACYLMNTYSFFTKWLVDVAADQTPEGGVPHVVPDILSGKTDDDWLLSQGTHSAAAWADVAVIMPWAMHLNFGDRRIIRRQYASMKNWINFMRDHAVDYIWNYKLQFGDWVALDAAEGSYFGATPNDLTCTAYFAYSTGLFVKMAQAIGQPDDAEAYTKLYQKIADKFQRTFFTEDGNLTVKTQTAHILALYFNLVPEQFRQQTVNGLIHLLDKEGGHLVTGFVGTPYFCHALSQNGRTKEAFDLLMKDDFPSWLYQVKQGATTIWEHWDGIRPDGTMWSPDMNSFNHYAYGAVDEWIFRVLGGLETDENLPGFKHSIINPHIGGGLEFARTTYLTSYGPIATDWRQRDKHVELNVTVPANTTAQIILDQAAAVEAADGLLFKNDAGHISALAGSGTYQIVYIKD
jgi:alpha-L-rhamnosidase